MDKFLQDLLYVVITAVVPILVGYIISFLKAQRDKGLQEIDNTYVKNTFKEVTDIILNVVDTVTQTFVDDLKKEGSFDETKQKEALEKAINQAKEMTNEDGVNLVLEKYGDLDAFIRLTIEAYIQSTKK